MQLPFLATAKPDLPGVEPLPVRRSLRAKGLVATLALFVYLLAAGGWVAWQRHQIYEGMTALSALASHERAVALAEAAISEIHLEVRESSSAIAGPVQPLELRLKIENGQRLLAALEEFDPAGARLRRAIERAYDTLVERPVRAHWIDLREALKRTADELEILRRRLAAEREALAHAWQRRYDAVTVDSLWLSVAGLAVFAVFAAWFFKKLSGDLRRLEAHAREIVHGARGVALEVRRDDELGVLMHAVNRMSAELDAHEQQIRLDTERRSHQDKLLAVGALAAGVAHEVNNPLAVIAGLAQELRRGDGDPTQVAQAAEMILAQTQRAALAARQLAEVAAPQPADLDWLDLVALTHHAVRLIGYDRRYRHLVFEVAADAQLPAVRSSAGAIQQLLMQLLPLVGDALAEASPHAPPARIEIMASGDAVDWHLLFAARLDFTRPDVQRALLLSRAIIEPLMGRLALGQAGTGRQRIELTLPALR